MDAKEYLARKGLDGKKDKEKATTLEEKAWERARGSHDHRPKAGTPHDWEDWERYHDVLAEGAEQLEQKIDHQAHHDAVEPLSGSGKAAGGVEHFTPEPSQGAATRASVSPETAAHEPLQPGSIHSREGMARALVASPSARMALLLLAVLLPPLAVAVSEGGPRRTAIAFMLMLVGWLPGVAYAVWWLLKLYRRHQEE
ncbi:YqaE/Pmp3 family membrane protein [Halomonas binhaiensis]|uniref:YqaE/Pmp3 family membrane protein n=1 Tax=Halomonas binhaiensis TaxID=2562282 RepID=A0A5C1NF36_9GAMM|nr:YqaE/Pmp3 family membrane protein [Halomonas binhaiensis]QEM82332.1 YqaE/Pmp3 family membrane protein [Halomonas binhaiensis]